MCCPQNSAEAGPTCLEHTRAKGFSGTESLSGQNWSPLNNDVNVVNLRPNYLGLLHEPSNVRYFSVIVGHEGAGTQGHLEYSCIISWNWKRLMSHLSLMAALVSLLKSFLKPIPASKSVKLFWALIRLVASRRTWDFWSNLDRSTITDKCRPLMKPTSQCHSLACWTSDEPHLVPCHQQSLCPLSHPQLEPGWRIALSSEEKKNLSDKCSLGEKLL